MAPPPVLDPTFGDAPGGALDDDAPSTTEEEAADEEASLVGEGGLDPMLLVLSAVGGALAAVALGGAIVAVGLAL